MYVAVLQKLTIIDPRGGIVDFLGKLLHLVHRGTFIDFRTNRSRNFTLLMLLTFMIISVLIIEHVVVIRRNYSFLGRYLHHFCRKF